MRLKVNMVRKREALEIYIIVYYILSSIARALIAYLFSEVLSIAISGVLPSSIVAGLRGRGKSINHWLAHIAFLILCNIKQEMRSVPACINKRLETRSSKEPFFVIVRTGLVSSLFFTAFLYFLTPTTTIALLDITSALPRHQLQSNVIISNESNRLNDFVLDYKNSSVFPGGDIKYLPNGTNTVVLHGDKKEGTLWSVPIKENITFIETSFRVIAENKTDNHAGLVWKTGNISYYVFLRPHSMAAYNDVDKVFAKANMAIREDGSWYDIKIVRDNQTILAYLDNVLILKFSGLGSDKLEQIGVRSVNNIAEFSPILIAGGEVEKRSKLFYSLIN